MKIAVLFPGQGSQYVGMGAEFVQNYKNCKEILEKAENVSGLPLGELCFNGPMEQLTKAVHLQPAITVTNLICYEALKSKLGNKDEIFCFAGHSLGEYSALYAAGVLTVEDTMRLVAKRGALMEREGNKNPGGMRAVLGLEIEEIEDAVNKYNGDGEITAANHNTPQQTVISGSIHALDCVADVLDEKGGKVIPLNVSVANHSPLVADAVPDFAEFMSEIEFKEPEYPVYFNVIAATETAPEKMKKLMASQIASRVRWCETISGMLAQGVDTFIEVGPKTVLKGMMKKIVPKGKKVLSLQVDSEETLNKSVEKLA